MVIVIDFKWFMFLASLIHIHSLPLKKKQFYRFMLSFQNIDKREGSELNCELLFK